jgi:hypothetical protein
MDTAQQRVGAPLLCDGFLAHVGNIEFGSMHSRGSLMAAHLTQRCVVDGELDRSFVEDI